MNLQFYGSPLGQALHRATGAGAPATVAFKRKPKMNTATEMSTIIGKNAWVTLDGLAVRVMITDAKVSYGKKRVMITPLCGSGHKWINAERLTFPAKPQTNREVLVSYTPID